MRNCVLWSRGVSSPLCGAAWAGGGGGCGCGFVGLAFTVYSNAMESAVRVLPHMAFAEAYLADSPPYLHICPLQAAIVWCSLCFTMSPFLPQSRTLSCRSPPSSHVVAGANLCHACVEAVGETLRLPPGRKVQEQGLAVTRSACPSRVLLPPSAADLVT